MTGPESWQLDGYQLDSLIGIGPHGEVWRGIQLATRRVVAVKKFSAVHVDELRRCAAVIGSLGSPYVVAVLDVGTASDGDVVVISDYVAGGSLASLVEERGGLTAAQVVTLVAALAGGLAAAHGRGVVHGNVQVSNVVLSPDGRPMLTDFGVEILSRPADDVSALAQLCRSSLRAHPPAPALMELLDLAVDGRVDAAELARSVLATGPAAPLRQAAVPLEAEVASTRSERHRSDAAARRGLLRFAGLGGVVIVGICGAIAAGSAWARHDAPVAGAPAARVASASPSFAASPRASVTAPDWSRIMSALETARDRALGQRRLALLTAVDAPNRAALSRDRALITTMLRSQVHPVGLRSTVLATQVVAVNADVATLLVTDEVSSYDVVDATGHVVAHRRARGPHVFEMQLSHDADGWRLDAVRDAVSR
jgi:hypothetical protein